jgi:pimeloyl-ACP methyl ester carboxylesterase
MLAYDRYGQGATTDRDPSNEGAADPMHAHDCLSVIHDLHQLIMQIANQKLGIKEISTVALVFVCNSVGCALARLYAQEFPGSVAGMVLLDSVLANSDFVSVFPDPDGEGFRAEDLPEGVTSEIIRATRAKMAHTFHPDVGSKEGLSRKNLRGLLPYSDAPVLTGVDGRGPFVTVIGHDYMAFAEESERMFGIPKPVSLNYTNPYWQRYNEGLMKITEEGRRKGPIQAHGAGHFIQRDNPAVVVKEISELLDRLI